MTEQKNSPRGKPGAGLVAAWPGKVAAQTTRQPQYSTFAPAAQPPPLTPAILLHNAETLLDDLDPAALGWAADLLGLAADALDKAARAELLADCCKAAGDQAGRRFWRRQMLAHQAVAWAATHPQEVIP